MKSGWQTSTLGDVLAVLRNGVNCTQDKSGRGDKISRIESISDACFNLEKVGYAELNERDKERYRLQQGDILFSHINSAVHVGKTAVFSSGEPVYHGVNLLLMRPKDVVTSAYLNYALKYLFQSGYWREICKQSVNQASVNQQDISRVQISYPKSLSEQRRVVGILDEALDAIATAKANAEKNFQNARALFESYLQAVFNERDKSWVEKKLGDESLLEIIDGDRGANYPKTSDFHDSGDCLFLNTKNVRPDGFDFGSTMFISAKKDAELRKGKLKRDDVVMTTRGTIGNVGLYSHDVSFDNIRINSGMLVFRPNGQSLLPTFLFELLRSEIVKEQIRKYTTGAAQPQLPIRTLVNFTIPVPRELDDQRALVARLRVVEPETRRLESVYQHKLTSLEALKKSLLQSAFSGEM
jgi:type I restriction enzyme S subunit